MQLLYDREGNSYQVSQEEADALLATGAYFTNPNACGGQSMTTLGPLVIIYDIATGQAIKRRPVDARELVASGKFAFDNPKHSTANPTITRAASTVPTAATQAKSAAENKLPTLSEENSKAEISATLAAYGVQYRSNMDKADLLNLWDHFVAGATAPGAATVD